MGTLPQMFFLRDCRSVLPTWLLLPVPGLGFLDSPLPFLSVLDSSVVGKRRSAVYERPENWDPDLELEDDDLAEEIDDHGEPLDYGDEKPVLLLPKWIGEVAGELIEAASAGLDGEDDDDMFEDEQVIEVALSSQSVRQDSPAVKSREMTEPVLSFYLEGRVTNGNRTPYSIKGEDFCIDGSTVISGALCIGTYAAIQGVIDENGCAHATIIVTDDYRTQ